VVFRAASGRRREKPLMNKIAPLISWLRMIAVRAHNNAHNMRSLVDRYFKHNVKLALGFPYTVLSGYVNALNIANRATVPFAYSPSQDSSDLMCFFVRLAEQIASPLPAKAAIDIVLNASPGCRVADYGAVARLFHDRVNLHIAWSFEDAERLCQTVASSSDMERLGSNLSANGQQRVRVTPDMIGRAHARLSYANDAREFLKSRGWSTRYCALSLPADWPNETILAVLGRVGDSYPDWRFVVLGDYNIVRIPPSNCSQALIIPCYSGAELSAQIALAMEADRYFGVANIYGMAAMIAGRPATIVTDAAGKHEMLAAASAGVSVVLNDDVSAFEVELGRSINAQADYRIRD